MYIAIEGLKGTGKSTLLERLPKRLAMYYPDLALLCPTRPMSTDHPLERLAANSADDAVRERLYAARSNHHASRLPRHASLILGDRSILTSYATRWDRVPANRKAQHIAHVDALEHRIGLPDHVILLEVPEQILLARLRVRAERQYGKHDEAPERLRSVVAAYRDLHEHAAELGLGAIIWHTVNAQAEPEKVLEHVLFKVRHIVETHRPRVAAAA